MLASLSLCAISVHTFNNASLSDGVPAATGRTGEGTDPRAGTSAQTVIGRARYDLPVAGKPAGAAADEGDGLSLCAISVHTFNNASLSFTTCNISAHVNNASFVKYQCTRLIMLSSLSLCAISVHTFNNASLSLFHYVQYQCTRLIILSSLSLCAISVHTFNNCGRRETQRRV